MSASFNDLSSSFSLALAVIVILLLSAPYCLFLFYRPPSAPPNAPKYISGSLPVLGAVRFWTARWDFFRDAMSQTKTGNFSYKVGPHSVVGVSGDAGREVFFGSAQLSLSEGWESTMPTLKHSDDALWTGTTCSSEQRQRSCTRARK